MTEILVATDLHGSLARAKDLAAAIEREKPALFVFLGDLNYNGARNPLTDEYSPREVTALIKELNTPSVFVKGNCDSEVDETVIGKPFPEYYSAVSGGKKILFTHGHRINPDSPPDEHYDAVFYGHTHVNAVWRVGGVTFVNLSSLSLPKGGSEPAYAVIDEGFAFIKNLQGNIIERIEL